MLDSIGGYGVGAGGLIALLIFVYTRYSGRGAKDAKSDLSKLMGMVQKKSEDKIESINHEQSKIEVTIKKDEVLAVEKQEAIRKIADEAAAKVEAIMNEPDLSKVTNQYNKDLEDI